MKVSFDIVSKELDILFMSPFSKDETPEIRAESIETFLKGSGYSWDSYLEALIVYEFNGNN